MHRLLVHPLSEFQYEQVEPLGRVLPGMFALLAGQATEGCDFPPGPITGRCGSRKGGIPPTDENVALPDLAGQFTK